MDSSNLSRYKGFLYNFPHHFIHKCERHFNMLGGPSISCERMAIEYIWLFLEESTTGRRERSRNCTQTVHNKPTAIFTTNFSKIVMAPSDGMAIFGRRGCCQVKLAGNKFILLSRDLLCILFRAFSQ